jgi:hypothetical protein
MLLVVLEVILRLIGFGNYPIYYKSDVYEYAFVPNQSLKRFGNSFFINEMGMRSSEIKPGEKLVLGFGDSVLNGGVALSQEELASSKIDSAIAREFHNMRFTNTSAGSWGVSNAYQWMVDKKIEDPKAIVLVFSSHDYDDKMEFQDVVREISFYPESQPLFAITDALEWVYSRYFEKIDWSELNHTRDYSDDNSEFDGAWLEFIEFTNARSIPLIIYHHPDKSEALNGKWNTKGSKLENLLISRGVETISGLNVNMEEADYRDDIHPSAKGQSKIARAIITVLSTRLKNEE